MSLRVLVAEDSLTVRRHLVRVLTADPDIHVVGEASTGSDAVALCRRLRPDAITLDILMSGMNGVVATAQIMAYTPTPILVVSATARGEMASSFDALAAGAVDVLEKPRGDAGDDDWERRLVDKVKLVARVKVITHLLGRRESHGDSRDSRDPSGGFVINARSTSPRLVALGTSTGGPAALRTILGALPVDFPLPILVVLHMSTEFSDGLSEWLGSHIRLPVAFARDGEPLPMIGEGCIRLAPPNLHLTVAGSRMQLIAQPPRNGFTPSIDALFESAAQTMNGRIIAGLLTGMGVDGAAGLLSIRRSGGTTFAQDAASSVVFGMPGAAVELDAAQTVIPLSRIAPTLCTLTKGIQR